MLFIKKLSALIYYWLLSIEVLLENHRGNMNSGLGFVEREKLLKDAKLVYIIWYPVEIPRFQNTLFGPKMGKIKKHFT